MVANNAFCAVCWAFCFGYSVRGEPIDELLHPFTKRVGTGLAKQLTGLIFFRKKCLWC